MENPYDGLDLEALLKQDADPMMNSLQFIQVWSRISELIDGPDDNWPLEFVRLRLEADALVGGATQEEPPTQTEQTDPMPARDGADFVNAHHTASMIAAFAIAKSCPDAKDHIHKSGDLWIRVYTASFNKFVSEKQKSAFGKVVRR